MNRAALALLLVLVGALTTAVGLVWLFGPIALVVIGIITTALGLVGIDIDGGGGT